MFFFFYFNQSIRFCCFLLLQEAALRTFHINDDCTKYCITVPTDNCTNRTLILTIKSKKIRFILVGGDQPLDENMPLKSLRQLSGPVLNIYIRYKERDDMDLDFVRVYPGILK